MNCKNKKQPCKKTFMGLKQGKIMITKNKFFPNGEENPVGIIINI